ncbi:uncharacterized protein TA16670 [Theileria annulata]|uniref:Major facilitator superfamily (MFS) profile domain-containing protein n=1 Tax=Theileria annulata TaxID=5874 RepID=Q4UJ06_THEAN|nr:uncharacterized protein TA16670 [Theileria annulata]CAI72933.1 hypothetical protein, conserved [Theileria annulata]|eukprot:XP_953611.1 hypothetical protein, conserved [Theileria annulata]
MDEQIEDSMYLKVKRRFFERIGVIFSVFNIATFLEYFNLQILPSSMRGLEMSLYFTSKDNSMLSMAENLGLVSFIPIWGALCDKIELKYILLFGVIATGLINIWLSTISNYSLILILRIFNGGLIGSVTPSAQKFIATNMQNKLPFGFGILHAVMCLGRMISGLIATSFSTEVYRDIYGWRIVIFIFGATSLALSPILLLVPKVRRIDNNKITEQIRIGDKIKRLVYYLLFITKESLNNATSLLLALLNFFSDGPFVAFNYVTLLIQYMRLSNVVSAVTTGLTILGGIIGGIIGAFISGYFDRKWPKHGLLNFGILNVGIRITTFMISFLVIDVTNIDRLYGLLAVCLIINGMTFMTVSCVDRTLLANVVMPSVHSSSISIIRCIGGVLSAVIFNPVLAKLNESVFHFQSSSLAVKHMPFDLIKKNSDALRYSISIISLGTTGVVLLLYIIIHFTYGKDCEKIKKRIEKESGLFEIKEIGDQSP